MLIIHILICGGPIRDHHEYCHSLPSLKRPTGEISPVFRTPPHLILRLSLLHYR